MPTVIKKPLKTIWEKNPLFEYKKNKFYSADQMIDAYFKGKMDQKNSDDQIMIEKLKENLNNAKKIVENLIRQLTAIKIKVKYTKLKITSVKDYEAIIVVAKSNFISPTFENAYKLAIDTKKLENNQTFNIYFSFMPFSLKIDEKKLLADGYILSYEQKT